MSNNPSFGTSLRLFRARKTTHNDDGREVSWNQQELAEAIGYSRQQVSNWERGTSPPPPSDVVEEIATALELSTDETNQLLAAAGYRSTSLMVDEETPDAASPKPAVPQVPPPVEPRRPPKVDGFVGRNEELTYFAEKLEKNRLAVISGMAGVGKTALATNLAEWVSKPHKTFWHSFKEGDGLEGVIWRLANFLAWHKRDDLWQLLQTTRLIGGQPPPTDTLFDYLLQLLRGQDYLICFDDFHFVDEDPMLAQFVERLQEALDTGSFSLLLTTRRLPSFARSVDFEPLSGLSITDARRLLTTRNVHLNEELLTELHTHVAGNAQFLTLALTLLQQITDPTELIEHLAEADDVERYLLTQVDEGLNRNERSVMRAVAVMLGYPATRDAVEAVLNGGNVWSTLRQLRERHLLTVSEHRDGNEYIQHTIVQGFYYEEMGRRPRRQMHHRAGDYYAEDEVDLLRSGIHYERAREFSLAAAQATKDVWTIINQGQIRQLRGLLECFNCDQLAIESWLEVNLAKGQVYTLQAEGELAERSLETVLGSVDLVQDKTLQQILGARACRRMGELLEEKSPTDALMWLEQGLEYLQKADEMQEAALHIRTGTIRLFKGQYEQAIKESQRGLALLPSEPSLWRAIALRDISGVNIYLGNTDAIIGNAKQAIDICKQLHDQLHMIQPLMNLAIGKSMAGDIKEGLTDFDHALRLANHTGNSSLQAQIEQNLGTAKLSMGEFEEAEEHLQTSLELARKRDNRRILLYSLRNLIDLYVDEELWKMATQYLEEAELLARELGDPHNEMTLFGHWCEVMLANGDADTALEYANRRLELAIELKEVIQQGISQAYLGKTLAVMARYDEAFAAFDKSVNLIKDEDPLQTALTKKDWGQALLNAEQVDEGIELLIAAKNEFKELETFDEVKEIEVILAPLAEVK